MAMFEVHTVPQLQQYLLTNVSSTGSTFSSGGLGSAAVELVLEGSGLTCVGKEVHVDSVTTLVQECTLLFGLRHPHIIQYLGLCASDSRSPLVVMEYLPHSLDHVMKNTKKFPLAMKHSLLFDVARGMEYLHCRPSPIIHGKVTATNIMLTSAMVAKLSDIGVYLHLSDTASMVSWFAACGIRFSSWSYSCFACSC